MEIVTRNVEDFFDCVGKGMSIRWIVQGLIDRQIVDGLLLYQAMS
jgi:hypothetical protein